MKKIVFAAAVPSCVVTSAVRFFAVNPHVKMMRAFVSFFVFTFVIFVSFGLSSVEAHSRPSDPFKTILGLFCLLIFVVFLVGPCTGFL